MAITTPFSSAISAYPSPNYIYDDNTTTTVAVDTIQGQPLYAEIRVSEDHASLLVENFEDEIKKKLTFAIAEELMKSKYIEYTRQSDMINQQYIFRARIFVTSDDKVRILRSNGFIK